VVLSAGRIERDGAVILERPRRDGARAEQQAAPATRVTGRVPADRDAAE
jgi:hypothetical protein